jgi:hypothetical protein
MRHKKKHLPEKICVVCGRPFAWRKKWAKDWEQVKYCSAACRKIRKPWPIGFLSLRAWSSLPAQAAFNSGLVVSRQGRRTGLHEERMLRRYPSARDPGRNAHEFP